MYVTLIVSSRATTDSPALLQNRSSNSASGISSKTGALGEGSVGGNTSGKGTESNAGGREMGDSDSSMKGDTSSEPNVNNEAPSSTKEISTDKESDKFSSDGSSKATSAEQ